MTINIIDKYFDARKEMGIIGGAPWYDWTKEQEKDLIHRLTMLAEQILYDIDTHFADPKLRIEALEDIAAMATSTVKVIKKHEKERQAMTVVDRSWTEKDAIVFALLTCRTKDQWETFERMDRIEWIKTIILPALEARGIDPDNDQAALELGKLLKGEAE